MEDIYVLNGDLDIIGIIDSCNSIIWANRYDKVGDCEIYLKVSTQNIKLLKKGHFIARNDDDMVCRIKKIDIDTDIEKGSYLVVTGYDIKDVLSQRIIWNQVNVNGNVEEAIYKIVDENLINAKIAERNIVSSSGRKCFKLDNKQNFKEVMSEQITYKNIEEKVQEICHKYGWGYKVKIKGNDFYFSLCKGDDRSNIVIFSPDFENLLSSKYTNDVVNLANVALIGGEGEGASRQRNISGNGEGINRYEIFVDAKDISRIVTWEELVKMYPKKENKGQGYIAKENDVPVYKMSYMDISIIDNKQLEELKSKYPNGIEVVEDENRYYQIQNIIIAELPNMQPENNDNVILSNVIYSLYLLTRGYEKLAEYGEIKTFEGKIEPLTTFKYKEDYFLGDIVTVRNEYGIEEKVRITEIIEVKDNNGYSVEPKFEYMEAKGNE